MSRRRTTARLSSCHSLSSSRNVSQPHQLRKSTETRRNTLPARVRRSIIWREIRRKKGPKILFSLSRRSLCREYFFTEGGTAECRREWRETKKRIPDNRSKTQICLHASSRLSSRNRLLWNAGPVCRLSSTLPSPFQDPQPTRRHVFFFFLVASPSFLSSSSEKSFLAPEPTGDRQEKAH